MKAVKLTVMMIAAILVIGVSMISMTPAIAAETYDLVILS